MKKKYILCLVLSAVIVLVTLTFHLLFIKSEVVLNVSQRQDSGIDFLFDYKNVNGLLDMRVWEKDSRKLLWAIKLNYFSGNKLEYGEIPVESGGVNSAQQKYPQNNLAPGSIQLDREYYVNIVYQHDNLLSARASGAYYIFKVGSSNFAKKVKPESVEKWQNP